MLVLYGSTEVNTALLRCASVLWHGCSVEHGLSLQCWNGIDDTVSRVDPSSYIDAEGGHGLESLMQ